MNHVFGKPARKDRRGFNGFTLAELLITLAIMGVLSALAISKFGYLLPAVRQGTSADSAGLLNRAVEHYDQVNSQISVPVSSDTSDEVAVVALLKARNPAAPGSPYIAADFTVVSTSSTDKVRLYWTGKFFKTIPEGTPGIGIAVDQ
jgi:prepilin-type N-terminal cleavage/methylation domain-containing protein